LIINETSNLLPDVDRFMVVGLFEAEDLENQSYFKNTQPLPVLGPATLQIRFSRELFIPIQGNKRRTLVPEVFLSNRIRYFLLGSQFLSIISMEPFYDDKEQVDTAVNSYRISDFFSQVGGVISITLLFYQILFGTPRVRPFGLVQRLALRLEDKEMHSTENSLERTATFPQEFPASLPMATSTLRSGDSTILGSHCAIELNSCEDRIAESVMIRVKQFLSRYYVRNVELASRLEAKSGDGRKNTQLGSRSFAESKRSSQSFIIMRDSMPRPFGAGLTRMTCECGRECTLNRLEMRSFGRNSPSDPSPEKPNLAMRPDKSPRKRYLPDDDPTAIPPLPSMSSSSSTQVISSYSTNSTDLHEIITSQPDSPSNHS
jgi:hypothetical protein